MHFKFLFIPHEEPVPVNVIFTKIDLELREKHVTYFSFCSSFGETQLISEGVASN